MVMEKLSPPVQEWKEEIQIVKTRRGDGHAKIVGVPRRRENTISQGPFANMPGGPALVVLPRSEPES